MESAVGIFFSTQNGSVASNAVASTPSEQLQAILGSDVSAAQVEALLRMQAATCKQQSTCTISAKVKTCFLVQPCPLFCCTSISAIMAMGECAVHLTTTLGRATDLSVVACLA